MRNYPFDRFRSPRNRRTSNERDPRSMEVNSGWSISPEGIAVEIHHGKQRPRTSRLHPAQQRVCVIFTAPFAGARRVQLVGGFTGWEDAPLEMHQNRTGFWFTALHLPPGDHPYAFLVDGERRIDPDAPMIEWEPETRHNWCHVAEW